MTSSPNAGWQPNWAVAPGETLRDALEERRMSQSELALRLGRPLKTINEIVTGKAAITFETAIQLERALGISARFWTGLETRYRETLARLHAERELQKQVEWLDGFPIGDMVKRKLISRGETKSGTLANVLSFLGIGSPAAFDRLEISASNLASPASRAAPKPVAAWLRWGELRASGIALPAFDAKRFRSVLLEVRSLTSMEPFDQALRTVQAKCLSAGVVVLLVPEFKGTHLAGAARWIRSTPLIQLTLRHKTDDQFWFSFFHSASHILSAGRKKTCVDLADADHDHDPEEAAADRFARDLLLPPGEYAAFVEHGDFTPAATRAFAQRQGLSPGIVAGRLQHDGHLTPAQARRMKRPIKLMAA